MSIDPLVLSNVIGDVIDPFNISTSLRILYNDRSICNGVDLKPSFVVNNPRVEVGGVDPRKFFTLVMVDPDAPTPSNPTLRDYLHWLVVDIPATIDTRFGTELIPYEKPQPMYGIHRIVFVLFEQLVRESVFAPETRHNFNTREFAKENFLGPPAAAMYFNCQREAGWGGRRFRPEHHI